MVFQCINIRQVPWEVLKTAAFASVFNTSHGTWRMLMHKKPCLISILTVCIQIRRLLMVHLILVCTVCKIISRSRGSKVLYHSKNINFCRVKNSVTIIRFLSLNALLCDVRDVGTEIVNADIIAPGYFLQPGDIEDQMRLRMCTLFRQSVYSKIRRFS